MAWLSTHPWVAVGVQITLVFVCYLLSPIDSATVAEAFACQYPYPYIGPFFYRVYFQKQWLPTCGWPTGGMQHLAMAQRPMLLRGDSLPSNAWKAHMRWQSREYIAKTFEPLLGVWQRPLYSPNAKGARHFVYFAERGEAGGRFGMRAPANSPPSSSRVVEHEEMDVDVFLRGSNVSDRMFYCSHDLAALGKRAMKDVEPLTPFGLRGGDTYNSDANNTSATNDPESRKRAATRGIVWLGTGRPVSHAHYDTSHNLFVQVVGKKHFTLWPPGAITQLKYFPTRHSMHRQSTWADPPTDASEMAFDVTLNEGDALYLPPFYAHQVAALTNLSISVAVWSTSDEASRKDALETLPLPWEAEWTRKEVIICAALFLRAVLIGVYGTGRFEAYYAVVNQVNSRFEPLRELPLEEQDGLVPNGPGQLSEDCAVLGVKDEENLIRLRRLRDHVSNHAVRVAKAVKAVSADKAVVEMALANYMEAVAEFTCGREAIYEFLVGCVIHDWW